MSLWWESLSRGRRAAYVAGVFVAANLAAAAFAVVTALLEVWAS